jgi:cyclohexyl-isocyanide hydratase
MSNENAFHAGLLVYPKLTQLDMTGPYEVLNRMPGARVHVIGRTADPVVSEHGLPITPTVSFSTCPALDLLIIPGGFGVNDLLLDAKTLAFVKRMAESARYVASVCSGSLVLGAVGLLDGKRATSHWMSVEFLEAFGAIPTRERVVIDGKIMTGGGVTAGIDLALTVVMEVSGREVAAEIQLEIEYDPAPPMDAGSPEKAGPAPENAIRSRWADSHQERRALVEKAAAARTSH